MEKQDLQYLTTLAAAHKEITMNPEMQITSFLAEMLQWEKKRYAGLRNPDYKSNKDGFRELENKKSREELTDILSRYLSNKAQEALGNAAITTMGVGNPPIYDQVIDDVDNSEKKCEVICKSNNDGMLSKYVKYTLVKYNSQWLIEESHSSEDKIKWRKKNSI